MPTEALYETYLLFGRYYNRIPYGQEGIGKAVKSKCPTCESEKGKLHRLGCGLEQCPACGTYAIICDCLAWDECEDCEARSCMCEKPK